jgi:hypothetical protein
VLSWAPSKPPNGSNFDDEGKEVDETTAAAIASASSATAATTAAAKYVDEPTSRLAPNGLTFQAPGSSDTPALASL